MEKIKCFSSASEAITDLDNGGHFYNIFTHAKDNVISQAEAGKSAGAFAGKQQAILHLELAMSRLDESSINEVRSRFDETLQTNFTKYRSQVLLPSEVAAKGNIGSNVIVTGIPKLTDGARKLSGFIMVPTGSAFTMIPLVDVYDIYEIRDEQEGQGLLIAHQKGETQLPEQKLTVGGVLKESDEDEGIPASKFLEIQYWVE